ncbi:MAG: NAD(P)H-dependent flavin oxidoreductase [Nocardioides sp.]
MGWVSGARLVSGTANAGGLGILASATMSYEELEKAIVEVKGRTDAPFGVNLRADASDAPQRVELLIEHGVKVASFALQPKPELVKRLKDHGIVVMPSIGAAKHAIKVAGWGADAVMVQGGEGGGHTGPVPTSLLLPQVGAESGGAVSAVRVAPPFSPVAALEVTPAADTSTRLPATSEASRCTSPLETATALPSVSLGPGSIVLASIATESEVARTRVVVW